MLPIKKAVAPFSLQSLYGYHDLVKLLLQKGATVTIRNRKGETPQSIARKTRQQNILRLLIRKED